MEMGRPAEWEVRFTVPKMPDQANKEGPAMTSASTGKKLKRCKGNNILDRVITASCLRQAGVIWLGLAVWLALLSVVVAGLVLVLKQDRGNIRLAHYQYRLEADPGAFDRLSRSIYRTIDAGLNAADDYQRTSEKGNPDSYAEAEKRFVHRQILIGFSGLGLYGLFMMIWVQRNFYTGGYGVEGDRIGLTCFVLAYVSVFGAFALVALLSWRHDAATNERISSVRSDYETTARGTMSYARTAYSGVPRTSRPEPTQARSVKYIVTLARAMTLASKGKDGACQ